jgi:hypothetical protein
MIRTENLSPHQRQPKQLAQCESANFGLPSPEEERRLPPGGRKGAAPSHHLIAHAATIQPIVGLFAARQPFSSSDRWRGGNRAECSADFPVGVAQAAFCHGVTLSREPATTPTFRILLANC